MLGGGGGLLLDGGLGRIVVSPGLLGFLLGLGGGWLGGLGPGGLALLATLNGICGDVLPLSSDSDGHILRTVSNLITFCLEIAADVP